MIFKNVGQVPMRVFMRGLHPSVGRADSGTIDRLEIDIP